MPDPNPPTTIEGEVDAVDDEALVLDDLLVEDVSIDGMCGVY
jgi:mycofactocin precursor